jgi:uncharacterized membrane protein YqjE
MLARLLAPQIDALVGRLRRGIALGAEVAADRVALARLEWEDEKRRLARLLIAILSAVWLGGLAVSFLGALVIIACWDTAWRIPAAAGVVLVLCVALVAVVMQVQKLLQQGDQSFALLRRELAADLETLRRMRDDTAPEAAPEPAPMPEGPEDAPRP